RFRRCRMCSIMGRLRMGTMGFGTQQVKGRSLVPSPPAMITAFMDASPPLEPFRCQLIAFIEHRRLPLGESGPIAFHRTLCDLAPVVLLHQFLRGPFAQP